jgi:hypothetical protein
MIQKVVDNQRNTSEAFDVCNRFDVVQGALEQAHIFIDIRSILFLFSAISTLCLAVFKSSLLESKLQSGLHGDSTGCGAEPTSTCRLNLLFIAGTCDADARTLFLGGR